LVAVKEEDRQVSTLGEIEDEKQSVLSTGKGVLLPGSDNNGHAGRLTEAALRKRFRLDEFIAEKVITLVAFVSLATILLIFVFVFREALPIFYGKEQATKSAAQFEEQETYGGEYLGASEVGPVQDNQRGNEPAGREAAATFTNLMSTEWQPISNDPKYGITPLVVGSLKVTFLAILFAAPLAILAALFTSSFAPKWSKEIIKPAIEILAGFPSVVIGFFALTTLASVLQGMFGYEYRLNAFVGGVAMSLAVLPIVFTISEDALTAVPKFMTEASLALGASRWQTAFFVTLPAATPGVFAAVVLGFGRAFGETMIVLMATGNAALLNANFTEPVRTMSATIGAEMAEVVFGDTHYTVLFFLGAILFLFTFVLNAVAEIWIRQRLLKRFRGG
jgi:phosphate transport system permease protein